MNKAFDIFKVFLDDINKLYNHFELIKNAGQGFVNNLSIELDQQIDYINNVDCNDIAKDIIARASTNDFYYYQIDWVLINKKFRTFSNSIKIVDNSEIKSKFDVIEILTKFKIKDIDSIVAANLNDDDFLRNPYSKKKEPNKIPDDQNNQGQNLLSNSDKSQNSIENFSVPQWCAIFKYVDSSKSIDNSSYPTLELRMKHFMEMHNINKSFNSFKNNFYKVRTEIDKSFTYPVNKLTEIIPFLEQKYATTINDIKNDIEILKNYDTDY